MAGKLPASIIYQDDVCCAFTDIQPVNPGHVLVIPIRHAEYLADLDEETGMHMFRIAQRIAEAIRASTITCEGVNLFLADGEMAGQEVFHVHLHVIPRYDGDGFGLRFGPEYGNRPSREEMDDVANRIRQSL
jgi:histidine triad (HIT) family protein